jgi:hypothetical protein
VDAPRFKENTGFCILCRYFKLLVKDAQGSGNSYYCISCDQKMRDAVNPREDEDQPIRVGPWAERHQASIQAHHDRIQPVLAAMNAEAKSRSEENKRTRNERERQRIAAKREKVKARAAR